MPTTPRHLNALATIDAAAQAAGWVRRQDGNALVYTAGSLTVEVFIDRTPANGPRILSARAYRPDRPTALQFGRSEFDGLGERAIADRVAEFMTA